MPIPKVFLDANVVVRAGKPPGGPIMARVADLAEADLVTILTTDLTITEVAKKHAENDYNVIKEFGRGHFRRIVQELLGGELPETDKADLRAKLAAKYDESTKAMFEKIAARTLSIDDVKPSIVFGSYGAGEGFFSGEGKKDQFPDAFIFECLKAEASEETPVVIVSDDGDFEKPVEDQNHISLVKSLPELFNSLGLKVDAPEVTKFLYDHIEDVIDQVDKKVSNWGFVGDAEDSDIYETNVTAVEFEGVTSFRSTEDDEDPILVVGHMSITTNLFFTHPDWDTASYDSEDKRLIPWDDVSGEIEVEFEVEFSMSIAVDDEGAPVEIEDLQFKDEEDTHYIELHPFTDD